MKKDKIFTTVKLPVSDLEAVVLEGTGKNLFNALTISKGDQGLFSKQLIIELVRIDDKGITSEEVDEMHMRDVSYLQEVISLMTKNGIE